MQRSELDVVDGHRVRGRPAGRRLARHACDLAVGVHHQHPVRARDRGSGRQRSCRVIERRGPRPRVDFVGALLCTAGLAGPVFALIEAPQRGWGDPVIVVSLVGGIAVFAAFIIWEQRTTSPMLPLRLFRRRNFSFANLETLAGLRGAVDADVLPRALSAAARRVLGGASGLALLPITVVMFVLSPRVGRLSMRFGPRLFMGVGPVDRGGVARWLTRLGLEFSYWAELFPILLGFSLGLSMIVAPLTATVLADAGESGRRDRERRQQRRRAHRRAARHRRGRRRGCRWREHTRPVRVPPVDGDHGRPHRPRAAPSDSPGYERRREPRRCRNRLRPRHEALRRAATRRQSTT